MHLDGSSGFWKCFPKLSIKLCMAMAIESKRTNQPSNGPSFVPFRYNKYT